MKRVLIGMMMSILAVGCIPDKQEPSEDAATITPLVSAELSQDEQDALIEEWLVLAKDPDTHVSALRPYEICDRLAQSGPTALAPILELLGDSQSSGATKVFVLQAVNVNMTPAYLPQLMGFLDSTDQTTRSCAVTLLGSIPDDSVVEKLMGLKDDENARVAFSALSGLAQQSGEQYRSEFVDLYFEEGATRARKLEIVRVVFMKTRISDIALLEAEVADADAPPHIRTASAMLIGTFGNLDSIPALQKSLEMEADEQYQQLVQSTIAALQERFKA